MLMCEIRRHRRGLDRSRKTYDTILAIGSGMGGFDVLVLRPLLGGLHRTIETVIPPFDMQPDEFPSLCMFPQDADESMIQRLYLLARIPYQLQSPRVKAGAELRHELRLLMKQPPVQGEPSNIFSTGKHSYVTSSCLLHTNTVRGAPHVVSLAAWSKIEKSMQVRAFTCRRVTAAQTEEQLPRQEYLLR